jgi:hypothetical protein
VPTAGGKHADETSEGHRVDDPRHQGERDRDTERHTRSRWMTRLRGLRRHAGGRYRAFAAQAMITA